MQDNQKKFMELRQKYPTFIYQDYQIEEDSKNIEIEYRFLIPGLAEFRPKIQIPKKEMFKNSIHTKIGEQLIFHIGLVELISYWKCTCSPNVVILCGNLNKEQKEWFKKLYYYGLGELFYTNGIDTTLDTFMQIEGKGESAPIKDQEMSFEGTIIPIGGGKDSVVTLELLKKQKEKACLIVNPKPVTMECARLAGYDRKQIIEINRTIDSNLISLNQEGYINGHTPFSSLLAFISYLMAYITGKKHIALSNENSANESNVIGEKINHQYSKSYEFEQDFTQYMNTYFKLPISYFSFLRPLNELQIAMLFSRLEQYHLVFKSCNVGSKLRNWEWCCHCPKCLFVYSILSPFLYPEKLVSIFKEDLFEKQELLDTFIDLIGKGKTKPFECVGTFEEIQFAITVTIQKLEKEQKALPYLLQYYKAHYPLADIAIDLTKQYNEENNLPKEWSTLLKKEVMSFD